LGGGLVVPDLDPSDLQRVEVLRGPQGTLYGASSLGGLLKYVTVDPSTTQTSGRIQADGSTIYNADGVGYAVRGAVNVPISEELAVRASAYTRHDPGYMDNIQTGERGVDRQHSYGGHLATLWQPMDSLSIKLSALLQDSYRHGYPEVMVSPGLHDLQQSMLIGVGGYEKKSQVYSAVLKATVGIFDLVSISGYSINELRDSVDLTAAFGDFTQSGDPAIGFAGFGVRGTSLAEHNTTDKFSQELRLSAQLGKSVDWLLGAFYTHEHSPYLQSDLAIAPTGAVVGTTATFNYPTTYEEYAAFADLTFHVTDRFDLQVGGREAHNKQVYNEVDAGPFVPEFEQAAPPLVYPQVNTADSAFTFLVTPRVRISPELMAYARVASGYRPGGPNPTSTAVGVPDHYQPDKTLNYEIGIKGDLLGKLLSFDASVYDIRWQDIQLYVKDEQTGLYFFSNGGKAKSSGAELSVRWLAAEGLTVAAWGSWNNAELTQNLPQSGPVFGVNGTRLPYSPRFSGGLSLEDEFHLGHDLRGLVGITLAYVGDRKGILTPNADSVRADTPAYARTDAHLGVKYHEWLATVFGNNLADRRGLLNADYPASGVSIIQPRTIGLSVSRSF